MAQGPHLIAPRPEWLALTPEEALEPAIRICDAHHHMWPGGPGGAYLLDEVLRDFASGHNVRSSIYVDSLEVLSWYRESGPDELKPVGETEAADAIAVRAAAGPMHVAAGIVGRADLALGAAVAGVLEAHVAASPRFRGVRHWLNHEAQAPGVRSDAPAGLAYDPRFREGFAMLERHDLLFEAWLYFPQLPDLAALARDFPGTSIVINHAGGLLGVGPYADRAQQFETWRRNIDEVARCPNVSMKIGGFGVPRCGFEWHRRPRPPGSEELAEAIAPYVLHCIERLGPGRCMFESNFPPDKAAFSYTVLWNAFKRVTKPLGAAERESLFHETAARVYRLPQPPQ